MEGVLPSTLRFSNIYQMQSYLLNNFYNYSGWLEQTCQTFQSACLLFHKPFKCSVFLMVPMQAQNPSCLYTINFLFWDIWFNGPVSGSQLSLSFLKGYIFGNVQKLKVVAYLKLIKITISFQGYVWKQKTKNKKTVMKREITITLQYYLATGKVDLNEIVYKLKEVRDPLIVDRYPIGW